MLQCFFACVDDHLDVDMYLYSNLDLRLHNDFHVHLPLYPSQDHISQYLDHALLEESLFCHFLIAAFLFDALS